MGGLGSGGSRFGGRPSVEGSCVLRLCWLRKQGAFRFRTCAGTSTWSSRGTTVASIGWITNTADSPSLTLSYSYETERGVRQKVEDPFPLIRTFPHLGGVRWWIMCKCGRRVAQVCKPNGAIRFRCRTCYRLTYQARSETAEWRAYRRAAKIAKALAPAWSKDLVPADLWDSYIRPPKPKWMRWRTYAARVAEFERASATYNQGSITMMHRLVASSDRKRKNNVRGK